MGGWALGLYLQSLIAESEGERRTKEGRKRGRLRDDDYTDELVKIWATMKSLNHFGVPDMCWVPIPQYGKWADCARYWYDSEAIKESAAIGARRFNGAHTGNGDRQDNGRQDCELVQDRNKRSVWSVASAPYSEAHFATFPPDLIKPCILAGCPVGGTVLDCFGGSGTTGMVALELGRNAILIELNPAYCKLIEQRTNVTPGLALC